MTTVPTSPRSARTNRFLAWLGYCQICETVYDYLNHDSKRPPHALPASDHATLWLVESRSALYSSR